MKKNLMWTLLRTCITQLNKKSFEGSLGGRVKKKLRDGLFTKNPSLHDFLYKLCLNCIYDLGIQCYIM
jgi:hypothetical protein